MNHKRLAAKAPAVGAPVERRVRQRLSSGLSEHAMLALKHLCLGRGTCGQRSWLWLLCPGLPAVLAGASAVGPATELVRLIARRSTAARSALVALNVQCGAVVVERSGPSFSSRTPKRAHLDCRSRCWRGAADLTAEWPKRAESS
jgi:hypothetical protein